jgi:hypothetical protein
MRVAKLTDRVVVTWEAVPECDEKNQSTFQVVLEEGGRVLLRYSNTSEAETAIVGIRATRSPESMQYVPLGKICYAG